MTVMFLHTITGQNHFFFFFLNQRDGEINASASSAFADITKTPCKRQMSLQINICNCRVE